MNKKTTFILLLLVIAVGAFIYFFEKGTHFAPDTTGKKKKALLIGPEQISYLSMERDNLLVECEKEKGVWYLRKPINCRADAGAIENILFRLESLECKDNVTQRERTLRHTTLADYGFDKPQIHFVYGRDDKRYTLDIGKENLLGKHLFVRANEGEDILVVEGGLLQLLPQDIADLRDHQLFNGDRFRVVRIGLRRPEGYLQLVQRSDGNWIIQQPIVARADARRVGELLEQLFSLRIKDFPGEANADAPLAGPLLGDELQITLGFDGEIGAQSLSLGHNVNNEPGYIYAKWANNKDVFIIPAQINDVLETKVDDLRDRSLLPFSSGLTAIRIEKGKDKVLELRAAGDQEWKIVEPIQARADLQHVGDLIYAWDGAEIERFVDATNTNVPAYDDTKTTLKVTFAWEATNRAKDSIGPLMATGTVFKTVYSIAPIVDGSLLVHSEFDNAIYQVSNSILRNLSVNTLDFRDRQILNLHSEDIRGISVIKGNSEQSIARKNSSTPFLAVSPATNEVNEMAVEGILVTVSRLETPRFVDETQEHLGDYGLDEPRMTLTLSLRGESGIQKSILFGKETPEGEVYTMVRGQDVVFMLPQPIVELLTSDLLRQAAP